MGIRYVSVYQNIPYPQARKLFEAVMKDAKGTAHLSGCLEARMEFQSGGWRAETLDEVKRIKLYFHVESVDVSQLTYPDAEDAGREKQDTN